MNARRNVSTLEKPHLAATCNGVKHKPDTAFANVMADVIADREPNFHRGNFCSVVRGSHWKA